MLSFSRPVQRLQTPQSGFGDAPPVVAPSRSAVQRTLKSKHLTLMLIGLCALISVTMMQVTFRAPVAERGGADHVERLHNHAPGSEDFRTKDESDADAALNSSGATIFVSFASFRDAECSATLEDMFRKAFFPYRIFVGVVEQRHRNDQDCVPAAFKTCQADVLNRSGTVAVGRAWKHAAPRNHTSWSRPSRKPRIIFQPMLTEEERESPSPTDGHPQAEPRERSEALFCPMDNVRYRRVTEQDAKGPTFGRSMASFMYRGESFFLMIDSHNRFVEGWDVLLVEEYLRAKQKARKMATSRGRDVKVVLSGYPPAYHNRMQLPPGGRESYTRLMCSGHFIDSGIFRLDGEGMPTPQEPVRQPFTAAGFLFGEGSMVQDVPFDPHLDFLFDGEEVLYSARLFTHGYDSYLPTISVLYHFYQREEAHKVWSVTGNMWYVHQKISNLRVLAMLEQKDAIEGYRAKEPEAVMNDPRILRDWTTFGMGSERTVKEFWEFAQVNVKEKRPPSARKYCLSLVDTPPLL